MLVTITAPAPHPTRANNAMLDGLSSSWDVSEGDPVAAPHGWLTLTCSEHFSKQVLLSLKRVWQIEPVYVEIIEDEPFVVTDTAVIIDYDELERQIEEGEF